MKTLLLCVLFFLVLHVSSGQALVPDYHASTYGAPQHRLVCDAQNNILVFQSFDHLNGEYVGNLAKLDANGQMAADFHRVFSNGNVMHVVIQRDGKILISGDFTMINGHAVTNLVRLNTNGTVDTSFASAISSVSNFQLQSTGRIVVLAGDKVYRLDSDGTKDEAFNATGPFDYSQLIDVDPSDKIYIGTLNQVFKLEPNGGLATDFFTGTGARAVDCLEVQSDGKLLIGGWFTTYNGVPANSVVRLLANGEVDATFNVGTGPLDQHVFAIAERADHNIVVGGQFSSYNNIQANLVELSPDGSLRKVIAVVSINDIRSIAESPDARIIIGGGFKVVNGATRPYVAKFNADYTLVDSFNPQLSYTSYETSVLEVRENGSAILAGSDGFEGLWVGGTVIGRKLLQWTPEGAYDEHFVPDLLDVPNILSLLLQKNGKLLIGGFARRDGQGTVARLNPDGTWDSTFPSGAGPTDFPNIAAAPLRMKEKNDTLYLAGSFNRFNGVPTRSIVATDSNGTILRTLTGLPADSYVRDFEVLDDGKVLVAGSFPNGQSIYRLNKDGTVDATYRTTTVQGIISFIKTDPDNRIYLGGSFYSVNGALVGPLVRLLPDGDIDTSFDVGAFHDSHYLFIRDLEILPDGRLAVGGYFDRYKNDAVPGFLFMDERGNRLPAPLVDFGNKSVTRSIIYSQGSLYLTGRFVKSDYADVYGLVKIIIDPLLLPKAPGNLNATIYDSGAVALQWSDSSSNEDVFVLERSRRYQSQFIPHDTLPANSTNALDSMIVRHQSYYYRVKAVNAAGGSAYSNVVSATWIPEPASPTHLKATYREPGGILVEWEDASTNENAFIIERSENDDSHFAVLDTIPPNTHNILDEEIAAMTEYFYRIKAVNSLGESAYSNIDSATWIVGLERPDRVKVTLHSPGVFRIDWHDNSSIETGFIVERSQYPESGFNPIDSLSINTSYDSAIIPQTEYFYRVKAVIEDGESPYSDPVSGIWIPAPDKKVAVYPIPAKNALYLEIPPEKSGGELVLLNSNGQRTPLKRQENEGIVIIDTNDLPPGIYLAEYVLDGNIIQTTRVIVSH